MSLSIEECFYLGYVSKTRGFKGELVFFLDVDQASDYAKLDHVLILINQQLHPYFISSIQIDPKSFARVRLSGIDSREQAAALSGKELYLPLKMLPELPDDQYYLHELKGMKVIDKKWGELGPVESVMDHSHNTLLQVFRNGFEVLIPLQEGFVKRVDKKAGIIEVEVPEELLEMNKI